MARRTSVPRSSLLAEPRLCHPEPKWSSGVELPRPSHYSLLMNLTAVYEPATEGGFTCWVEEIPAAISEGETIEEAERNLMEALKLVQAVTIP